MAKRPAPRRPAGTIYRLPLEDIGELWYWGSWKELVPSDFSTHVIVVCTSRRKCLEYKGVQTHDYFLLEHESRETTGQGTDQQPSDCSDVRDSGKVAAPQTAIDDIFDDGRQGRPALGRRFRLVSFEQFVEELRRETEHFRDDPTLVVNPRKSPSGDFLADAIWHATAFLRDLEP